MTKGAGSSRDSFSNSIWTTLKAAPMGYSFVLFGGKEIRDLPLQMEKHKPAYLSIGRLRRCASVLFALLLIFLLAIGCATQRLAQFKAFSEAGTAYADSVTAATKEAGEIAIRRDTLDLIQGRASWTAEKRREAIETQDAQMKVRLALLAEARRHAKLLRTYFASMDALARSDAPAAAGQAAQKTVDALSACSQQILGSETFGASISQGVGKLTELIVGHFQKRALEKELRKHGNMIRREIEIQRLLLKELGDDARQHLQVMKNLALKNDYRDPYFSSSPLPSSWSKTRSELLNAPEAPPALTAAEEAAAKLQDAFSKLLAGGSNSAEWEPSLIELRIDLDSTVPFSE